MTMIMQKTYFLSWRNYEDYEDKFLVPQELICHDELHLATCILAMDIVIKYYLYYKIFIVYIKENMQYINIMYKKTSYFLAELELYMFVNKP